jgi:hypothetical protein
VIDPGGPRREGAAEAGSRAPANAANSARVNRAQVLRLLQEAGQLTRPELVRLTGLTAGSISNVVRDLVELRLVAPTGATAPRRISEAGMAAALLGLDPSWNRVLAVHQGVSRLRLAATDLGGDLLVTDELDLKRGLSWQWTVGRIGDRLLALVRRQGWDPTQIRGVGVGAVGLVDARTGTVRAAPNLGWKDVPLRSALPWPVAVRNNVHAMALGDKRFGGLGDPDAVYVYVGTGIGSGILSRGSVMGGVPGAAALALDEFVFNPAAPLLAQRAEAWERSAPPPLFEPVGQPGAAPR